MAGAQADISRAFAQRKPRVHGKDRLAKAPSGLEAQGRWQSETGKCDAEKPQVSAERRWQLEAALDEDAEEEMEVALRAWDMDMRYGPCIGVTRLQRWERAKRLGLSPPEHVHDFLVHAGATRHCLWENRV